MIKKNSQSYRILALVAMSGECSIEALGILMPQESYRKKLLMQLVKDKWIRLYEKDGLRGYRLGRRGKEFLLQTDQERFAFFVPKEVKVQSDFARKIINSKITGVWLTESAVWICYNMGTELMNWYGNIEQRADILVRSILKMQGIKHETSSMILFGHRMEQALYCLDDSKTNAYIMNSFFERVCFIPLTEYGKPLLRLIGDADMYEHLLNSLKEDLREDAVGRIECDGIDLNGRYVLICMDMDLKKLIRFVTQMRYIDGAWEIYCFDFQKDIIRRFCGDHARISLVDFAKVREILGLI